MYKNWHQWGILGGERGLLKIGAIPVWNEFWILVPLLRFYFWLRQNNGLNIFVEFSSLSIKRTKKEEACVVSSEFIHSLPYVQENLD